MCASFPTTQEVTETTAHVSALAQQLVNHAAATATPSGSQQPSITSSVLENPGLPTSANQLQLPPFNAQSITMQQQDQSSTLNTQLMDMILSLQNQMQQLQQQQAASQTKKLPTMIVHGPPKRLGRTSEKSVIPAKQTNYNQLKHLWRSTNLAQVELPGTRSY